MSTTTQTVEAAVITDQRAVATAGPWRLERALGRGGQGSTWLGRHAESGALAAIKCFRVAEIEDWKRFELFEREAATLAALEHPAIPRFIDRGASEDGTERWIAMELIEGQPLSQRLGLPSSPPELARIFGQILDVLEYLHGRTPPVLHRDLKPHNLILRSDGRLAVVDFGSVRTALAPEGSSTVVGTFGYLAPEQLHGAVSPSSDLYALGVTMIALASGTDGATLPRKGLKVDVARILGDYPDRTMREVWGRMVEPDPDQRPQDVAAVRAMMGASRPTIEPSPAPEQAAGPVELERPAAPLKWLVLFPILIWLQLASWFIVMVRRLILPGVHRKARRRISKRHRKNQPRKQAELDHLESRYALQQVRLDQAREQVTQWKARMTQPRLKAQKHGRGRIPRGRRA